MDHYPINFSPYAINVLDCVGQQNLVTPDGQPVSIRQDMRGWFIIQIGDERMETPDNLQASYILNQREVGIKG